MPAYSHLLDEERDQIAVMKAAGRSICTIARALQRAKSTVTRELRRNALSSGRYSPLHAPEPINCAGGVKPSSRKIRN
jgi:transposase, IS30 family